MTVSPVFIVGSPRSGTSILISALLRAGYGGFYEGNFLSLVTVIDRDVERHYTSFYTPNPKVLMSKVDKEDLKHRLTQVIVDATVQQQPPGPWVDKTGGPEMIEAIPTLRRLFPTSRFIFAKRRAFENIVSRLVKFPGLTFQYHCADWARTMAAWRTLRGQAAGPDMIEVDQREISATPEAVARKLSQFLDMSQAEMILMLRAFTSQRPQETGAGTADRVLSMDTVTWTDEQKAIFHKICDAEMQAEGYSEDTSYWKAAAAA